MAIEPDLSYSWLPPTSSTPSTMEEVDLSNFTPTDLISAPKAVKSTPSSTTATTSTASATPHLMGSNVPLETIHLQEETFILTPVTQPFQIQLCVDQEYEDSGGGGGGLPNPQHSSAPTPYSHLQEPLNDPMLPINSKNNNIEARKSIPGMSKSTGYSYLGSHFSPVSVHSLADSGVSSLSETVSENTSERILNNAPATPNYLDIDFDQIVEDVDDMFRERYEALERQKADDEDTAKTSDLIKRNMPPEYFFTYTSKNPEELAHDLAKSLVEKALESERRKYLENDLSVNLDDIFENWADVSGNRAMESILEELIGSAVNEMATSILHTYNGDFAKFKDAANSQGRNKYVSYSDALQEELDVLVSDILAESDENCLVSKKYGLYQIAGPSRVYDFRVPLSKQKVDEKAFMTRWRGYTSHVCTDECNRNRRIFITAKMRREAERKRRNRAGILLSSLKKKVYHCRCIDCRQERKMKGVPEPSDSIEVKELNVPENIFPKEGIPILKKNGRGRPRKYPRVEDFRRWFVDQQEKKKKNSQPELDNDEKDKSIDSKTKISYPSPSAEIVRIDNLVKKRPRGRPPKYQVSVQPNESDNLKIKLSRKRPSRSTYSKVNYVDCDSSDEGYSESVKESFQDDKVYRKTYKRPAKRRRTTRTSKKAIPSSTVGKKNSASPPECDFECLESAIKTVTDSFNNSKSGSSVPNNNTLDPEAIPKDSVLLSNERNEHASGESSNISEAAPTESPREEQTTLAILESQASFVYEKPETISKSVMVDGNLTCVQNNLSVNPESCATLTYSHAPSITNVTESSQASDPSAHYVIIQEVDSLVNNIFKPKMSETGIQTSGNYVDNSVSVGFETPRENNSVLVSKSIQTNISLETITERPSYLFKSNCSTQSISTSTDISVCTNTNELLHTMHLTDDSEIMEHFVNSPAIGFNKPREVVYSSSIEGKTSSNVSFPNKVDSYTENSGSNNVSSLSIGPKTVNASTSPGPAPIIEPQTLQPSHLPLEQLSPQSHANEKTQEYDLPRPPSHVNTYSDESIKEPSSSNSNLDETDCIKTYSRKVLHSPPSMNSCETKSVSTKSSSCESSSSKSSSSSESEKLLSITTSSFDIVPLTPELVNLDINEKDLTPSTADNFEKSLSMNEALKDEESSSSLDIREPRSTSLFEDLSEDSSPPSSPSKSQFEDKEGQQHYSESSQDLLFPRVILKRLSPEVINSWCNRHSHLSSSSSFSRSGRKGEGLKPFLVPNNVDCFKDEIYSTGGSRVHPITMNNRKISFFREDVDDAVVPHIPDEDILQPSKTLPVYASMKKKKKMMKRKNT